MFGLSHFIARFHFDASTTVLAVLVAVAATTLQDAEAGSPPITFVAEEAGDGDMFGSAVDVSEGLIAVGAYSADLERDDVGAVYLFDASSEGVTKIATLTASDGDLGDVFGGSVAVSGDVVLVGAPGIIQSELNEGGAYLFERDGDVWTEVAKLRRRTTNKNDMFGGAVDLDGGIAAVGAPGADVAGADSGTVIVYERSNGGWQRVATLSSEDAASGSRFGSAVAVNGDRILVGASGDVLSGEDAGSAYLFERRGESWREVARLVPSDGKGGDAFGDAVALVDDLALVGARFADLTGRDEGAAYVFERTSDGWQESAKLTAPTPKDRDQFGNSVALAADVALVAAPRADDPAPDAGAVWAFVRGADGWVMERRLSPESADMYDEFGGSVAADGFLAVVGTPQDIPEGESDEFVTGTVTIFRAVNSTLR